MRRRGRLRELRRWLSDNLAFAVVASVVSLLFALSFLMEKETVDDPGKVLRRRGGGRRLKIRFMSPGDARAEQAYKQLLRVFERENPDIEVEFIKPAEQRYSVFVTTQMAAGNAADVMFFEDELFPNFAEEGVFLPLDDFIRRENYDLSDFFPLGLQEFTHEGVLYGLPQGWGAIVLFYNRDLFRRFGLEWSDDWTWPEFVEVAKKLTRDLDGDGKIDIYGYQGKHNFHHALVYIWSNGGEVLSPDKKTWTVDTPANRVAFRAWCDLWLKHGIQYQYGGEAEDAFAALSDPFLEGRVAITERGPYYAEELRNFTRFRWGIGYHPKSPYTHRRITRYYGDGYVIWRGTRHPEAAWRLLKFLAGPVGQRMIARLGRSIPARKSVAYSPVFDRPDTSWDEKRLLAAAEFCHLQPITGYFFDFSRIVGQHYDQVFLRHESWNLKRITPEECLRRIQRDLEKAAARYEERRRSRRGGRYRR